jgi:uncharacterized protein GlcG (DUF336 family)
MAPRSVKRGSASHGEGVGSRVRRSRRSSRRAWWLAGSAAIVLAGAGAGPEGPERHTRVVASRPSGSLPDAGGIAQILTAADVTAVITTAAGALDDDTMAVAVVDRAGTILGVYSRPSAAPTTPDIAVSLARTTGYFSNDQAPLASRTVRFISGIHFPPGIQNTANAALYGVENINRGCTLDILGDAIFNSPIDRPRSLAGTFGAPPLPCQPSDTRGCAVGGPVQDLNGAPVAHIGITTGKIDLFDTGSGTEQSTYGGGVPLFRDRQLIGGVGVAGVSADRAEYAALVAAAGSGRGITTAIDFPNPLPEPGSIVIDGLRLPFVKASADVRPAGSSAGTFAAGMMIVPARDGRQAPEGYLIGPRPSTTPGGLTLAEVGLIVDQAVAQANRTRAQVRLPFGQSASFIIAITDADGSILAEFRMRDALFDAVDVVPSKARNAYYFSTREGYEVLRDILESSAAAEYRWQPDPPAGQGWALTSRTLSFGGQPLFPPGIDLDEPGTPGPWFDLFVYDTNNPCTEGPGPSRGGDRSFINQNGITWFPGSAPLYRNGQLVGGLGVSGDGVEQNDLVTAAGAQGFEPESALRVDNSFIVIDGASVRLPYLKYPRNPEEGVDP